MVIYIHYDFTNSKEISYKEVLLEVDLNNNDMIYTNCLSFFCFDCKAHDVIIIDKEGNYISRNELLLNQGNYTTKEIRKQHNILKMFLANSFNWQIDDDVKKMIG
jgi:hypothetical protein